MFIAAALLFRFKGSKRSVRATPALGLLDPDALGDAEILGRGMRLGAVLTGASAGLLPKATLEIVDGRAVLSLDQEIATLEGEDVGRRLAALNQALGAKQAGLVALA